LPRELERQPNEQKVEALVEAFHMEQQLRLSRVDVA
jgi:hypothetical protein